MDLLREISRCPIVAHCLGHPGTDHPCAEIVRSQGADSTADHQVPEPWSGHLDRAPILFLSSNPSISDEEDYPRAEWTNPEIADFFDNRFGGGRRPWIKDGVYGLDRHGRHGRRGTQFWIAVRSRAAELTGRPTAAVVPGEDYALSEVVHCKSRAERGVASALATCVDRYLEAVVSASAARVIVCLGEFAAGAVRRRFGIGADVLVQGPITVGRAPRYFAFLPHPASWKKKTFTSCLPPEDVRRLRGFLEAQGAGTAHS